MLIRRYLIELGVAISVYTALLVASIWALSHHGVGPAWEIPVALAPMIGGLLTVRAVMRQFRRGDELQRRMQVDIILLSFALTALVTFSYGFLENVGFPRLSMFVVWPFMSGVWAIGSIASIWRYRGQ